MISTLVRFVALLPPLVAPGRVDAPDPGAEPTNPARATETFPVGLAPVVELTSTGSGLRNASHASRDRLNAVRSVIAGSEPSSRKVWLKVPLSPSASWPFRLPMRRMANSQ